ncbi:MAG TPA: N-6 DNA methylase [Clostridium sp.]|uniref:Eco57I restriction-modification methylase domain-containing protein n=1 Tax=Clostridium sp. TaxID=1506 RepID=UPI002F92F2B0
MYTKKSAKANIEILINEFKLHESYYNSKEYKEAETRLNFIDKFFEFLGWSVNGIIGTHPKEQEVIVEKSVDDEKSIKFIDYTFQYKGKVQFLIEAKKPSESLKNLDHIFQAKSYAFTEEIPFVILTNFKEFKLFDISVRPLHNQPNTDLVSEFDISFEDYIVNFDSIWDTFSREAVVNKSLAKLYIKRRGLCEDSEIIFNLNYAQIKGQSLLDKSFLKDLREWRLKLAQDVFDNNPTFTKDEINEVVQRTLDRIIFIRILEDREIEGNEHLRGIIHDFQTGKIKSIKNSLDDIYVNLNSKYNGLLFHHHDLSNEATINNEIFVEIVENVYYPNSPYNFKIIRTEILGRIFEQYLGERIIIEDDKVSLELKDELKKAGGVYYTPQYIVEKIVYQSLSDLLYSKEYSEIKELRIADIACGSGSFLIEAYKFLIKYHENYFQLKKKDSQEYIDAIKLEIIFENNSEVKLTMEYKKVILEKNIFGVDIDPQAIEVSKMSLYITMLEEGYMEGIHQPILPDLNDNLMNGNSIINSNYIICDESEIEYEQLQLVNVFDWDTMFEEVMGDGGFDCIIGNPPYIRIQTYEELYSRKIINYIKCNYKTAVKGNFDIFIVFIERALSLLKEKGTLGFIVMNRFFITEYGEAIREIISNKQYVKRIVDFGNEQIFNGVITYTCLLFLRKEKTPSFEFSKVGDLVKWKSGEEEIKQIKSSQLTKRPWLFMDDSKVDIENQFESKCCHLQKEVERIFVGLQTDCDEVYILEEVKRDGDFIYCKSQYTGETHKFETSQLKPFLKGSLDIKKYSLKGERKWLLFPYKTSPKCELISEEEYQEKYPLAWAYIKKCESRLKHRKTKGQYIKDIPAFNIEWYGHIYKKNLTRFEQKKIVFPAISKSSCFALDEKADFYFVGSGPGGGGGCAIIPKDGSCFNYYNLLGILNSKVVSYQIKIKGTPQSGGYYGMSKRRADVLFIPIIDESDTESIKKLQQIETLVKGLLKLYENIKTARKGSNNHIKLLQQAHTFERKIDRLVFQIYGFNQEQISFIESNTENL